MDCGNDWKEKEECVNRQQCETESKLKVCYRIATYSQETNEGLYNQSLHKVFITITFLLDKHTFTPLHTNATPALS